MSDPQSYCPFCKRTHDAPEFIEALKRIAELEDACVHWRVAESIWDKDAVDRLQARVDELEVELEQWKDSCDPGVDRHWKEKGSENRD